MSFERFSKVVVRHATFLIISAVMTVTSSVYAGNFVFRIDGLTPDPSILCDDLAFNEGQRLAKFAGDNLGQIINITEARCVVDDYRGSLQRWDIKISYSADKTLPTVSTNGSFVLSHPTFPTKDACIATIEAEKEIFTRQTHLPVFLAYCVVPAYDTTSWEINVTGFGDPEIRPYALSSNVFGTILGHNRDSFSALLAQQFAKFGCEIAQISIQNATSHQNLAIRYYGSDQIRLEEMIIAKFQTSNECNQVVEQTQSILNDADLRSFGVYCLRDSLMRSGAVLVTMSQFPSAMSIIRPEMVYNTLDACSAAKQGIVDHYKNDLRRDIKAGYCTFENDFKKFRVVMIEKRKA